jgi:hypothetical protein
MSPGRPSLFTQELADRICARLAAGETLRAVCRDEDMPSHATVIAWAKVEPFSDQYAKAREAGYRVMADEILEIADDGANDTYQDEEGNTRTNIDVLGRSRLRVDTRKWLLSKALPKIYGDKIAHVGGEDGDSPIRVITEIRRTIVDA